MEGNEGVFTKIEKKDVLSERVVPESGTRIMVQRHGKYERDLKSSIAGSLTPEGVKSTIVESQERIKNILDNIPEKERADVMFLVLGSDTAYGQGARSMETAQIALDAIKEELKERGLDESQILNTTNKYRDTEKGKVRPTAAIREPLMIKESPDFLEFLKEKYGGMNFDFWFAYETDADKEKRLEMGAEGVDDMANRLNQFITVLKKYSDLFHKKHPNKRLVIWTASHYDTISPWSRKFLLGQNVIDAPMPVDYGAGISIDMDQEGNSSTIMGGKEYKVKL